MPPVTGHRFPAKTFNVDPTRVFEYVAALGVPPEPHWRPEIGAPVPGGFFMYVTTYGAEDIHAELEFDPLRTVYGGTKVEYLLPVRVGDELRVEPVIADVRHKEGRSGRLTFVDLATEYITAHGRTAVRECSTTIERG
jgi:hypothetical protein